MSKLDDLITQLCPDGVEYRKLGEVVHYIRGITYSKTDEVDNDGYVVLRANNIDMATNTLCMDGVKHVSSSVDVSAEKRLLAGDTLICAGSGSREHVGKVAFISESLPASYTFGGFMGVIRAKSDIINSRFLYFVMSSSIFRDHLAKALDSTTINNINSKIINGFVIPIPPLPIQAEIVRILDSFTELQTKLQAELQTELTLRQKQYEYYRNRLLTFDPDNPAVEWIAISNLCNIRNGYTPSKSNKSYWTGNDATIPWFRMDDIRANGHILSDSLQHITPAAVKGKLFPANSIILATTATIGEHALITADSLANQQFTYLTIRELHKSLVDPKYFYYYMYKVDEWCKSHVKQSSFPAVDMTALRKLEIPIPPLSTQQRIVNILDKFSDYTTSLTNGLPAEIKLRQQQYEYYRDKLLTFRHLSPTN